VKSGADYILCAACHPAAAGTWLSQMEEGAADHGDVGAPGFMSTRTDPLAEK